MEKQYRIVHFLSLFLTIIILYIIMRILETKTEFIIQHKEILPYVVVVVWVLAVFSVYLLYKQKIKQLKKNKK